MDRDGSLRGKRPVRGSFPRLLFGLTTTAAMMLGMAGAGAATAVADTASSGNTVIDTISVGTNPGDVAITPDGSRAYVTNYYDKSVSVIDADSNTVIGTVRVGNRPSSVAFSP
ncbi:YncE family protein, partial [Rhodococcus marinonascens]|uniref:YncE family protein n=1 Tax=Rhodococcus marinonascens TaxID=38311 RepID=UPI000AC49737